MSLADRELIGEDWLEFLNQNSIRYHIRIRNNFKVFCHKRKEEIYAWHFFNSLKYGELRHYNRVFKMHGEYGYLSGMKILKDGQADFCILFSFSKPEQAMENYKQRWQIETLFRGLKSSGFNLEDTHVTHLERLEKLIFLVMVAFVWCYKIGDYIDNEIKPIVIKSHGRRAISVFKYGLEYLTECLITNRNKHNINLIHFLSCT